MGGPEMRLLQRQLQLPPRGRRFAPLSLQHPERGIDAEWLQDPENLGANGMISAQTTERDAPPHAMVHASALAVIAARLAAITHIQLAAALAATQEPRHEQLTPPHRSSGRNPGTPAMSTSPRRTAPLAEALPFPVALSAIILWLRSNSLQVI